MAKPLIEGFSSAVRSDAASHWSRAPRIRSCCCLSQADTQGPLKSSTSLPGNVNCRAPRIIAACILQSPRAALALANSWRTLHFYATVTIPLFFFSIFFFFFILTFSDVLDTR